MSGSQSWPTNCAPHCQRQLPSEAAGGPEACSIDAQIEQFDPGGLLQSLHKQGVKFVVIGGVATSTLGSPSVTFDLDICFERYKENLEVLARVLRSLHARPRGFPPDLPFKLDATTLLLGDHFMFSTDLG